jgi:hypothetical protein
LVERDWETVITTMSMISTVSCTNMVSQDGQEDDLRDAQHDEVVEMVHNGGAIMRALIPHHRTYAHMMEW